MTRRQLFAALLAAVAGVLKMRTNLLKVRKPCRFAVTKGEAFHPEGIRLRHVSMYDPITGQRANRVDVLYAPGVVARVRMYVVVRG